MTTCQRFLFPQKVSWITSTNHKAFAAALDRRLATSSFGSNSWCRNNLQTRCRSLVSIPKYNEQRKTPASVRSPNVMKTPGSCIAIPTDSTTLKRQAIVLAAEEADQLLVQSAKHHEYYKSTIVLSNKEGDAPLSGHDEAISQEVAEAANKLLMVSAALQDKIGSANLLIEEQQHQYAKYISVLHRAFLTLTAKCLDAIGVIQATSQSSEHTEALLHLSLALARRAHTLGLPFHLPLHQRLMEAVAYTLKPSSSMDQAASVILEIASFTSSLTTAVPLHGALFRPSLLALISKKQFDDAVDLLHGMRDYHGLTVLDRATATELYTSLHAVVKSSFCVRRESRRDLPESPITEIVAMLEPSVLLFADEWARESKTKQDKLRHLLDSIDEFEMQSLLSSVKSKDGDGEDADLFDSDDESDEYTNVVVLSASKIDPLDHAVNTIITKRVKTEQAKAVFSGMVSTVSSPQSRVPRIITVTANLTPEEAENTDFWTSEYNDMSSDSESDDDHDDDMEHWMKTRRTHFPDVTAQIEELNNGRKLSFTANYENIMWLNEDTEDFPDEMEYEYDNSSTDSLDGSDEEEEEEEDDDDGTASDDDDFPNR